MTHATLSVVDHFSGSDESSATPAHPGDRETAATRTAARHQGSHPAGEPTGARSRVGASVDHTYPEVPRFRGSGFRVPGSRFQGSGVPGFWGSGVPNRGTQEPRNRGTAEPPGGYFGPDPFVNSAAQAVSRVESRRVAHDRAERWHLGRGAARAHAHQEGAPVESLRADQQALAFGDTRHLPLRRLADERRAPRCRRRGAALRA